MIFLLIFVCVASSVITRLISNRPASETPEIATSAVNKSSTAEVIVPIVRSVSVTNTIDWSKVESADYLTYIQNLRAIGCPPETLADIIVADVNKLFAERAKQFLQGTNAIPKYEYWKGVNEQRARAAKKAELKKHLVELDAERISVIRRLLQDQVSVDQLRTPWSPLDMSDDGERLSFLSEEKRSALKQVNAEMDAETRKRIRPGSQDLAGLKELERLRQEREAKIAQLLTPEEKLEFDLRSSSTASRLRVDLEGFSASEEEFRRILPIRKEFEDKYNSQIPPTSVEDIKEHVNSEGVMLREIRSVLGDARYEEYRRLTDPNFKFLRSTFKGSEIPDEQLIGVYNIWSGAQTEAERVRYDPSLTPEYQRARLAEISSQAQAQIRTTLGDGPGAEIISQNGSKIFGRIETLNPPRPSATTTYLPK